MSYFDFSIYFHISSFFFYTHSLSYFLFRFSNTYFCNYRQFWRWAFYPFSIFSYRLCFLYYFPISHNKSLQLTVNQVTISFYFHLCCFDFPMNSIATIVNSEDKPFYPFPYFPTGFNFTYFPYYFPISLL